MDQFVDALIPGSSVWLDALIRRIFDKTYPCIDWLLNYGWVDCHSWRNQPMPGPGPAPTPPPDPDPSPSPAPPPVPSVDPVYQRIAQASEDEGLGLSPADIQTATDQCEWLQARAAWANTLSGDDQPCLTGKLYFPGSNAGAAAIHDRDAILSWPAWFQLTYENESTKGTGQGAVPRRWYDNAAYKTVCPKPRGDQACDEYPYYPTVEGGPETVYRKGADLRPIPGSENSSEGASRGLMYNDPACNMAVNTAGLRTLPGNQAQKFFVVPVAFKFPGGDGYYGPRSFHICSPGTTTTTGGGGGGVQAD